MKQADSLKMEDNLFEFRNYIIKDLIDRGYKYIARDEDGAIYTYSSKPAKRERMWFFDYVSVDDTWENISLVSRMFTDVKWEDVEPFKISHTNWDDVPVDTKVIVTGVDDSEWKCHFCKKYDCSTVSVFNDGKISWTTTKTQDIDIRRVRLA